MKRNELVDHLNENWDNAGCPKKGYDLYIKIIYINEEKYILNLLVRKISAKFFIWKDCVVIKNTRGYIKQIRICKLTNTMESVGLRSFIVVQLMKKGFQKGLADKIREIMK